MRKGKSNSIGSKAIAILILFYMSYNPQPISNIINSISQDVANTYSQYIIRSLNIMSTSLEK